MELRWKASLLPSPVHCITRLKGKMRAPCFHVWFFLSSAPKQSCSGRSPEYFHHFISTYHFTFSWDRENPPPTKQILMSVRLVSDPSQDADLTNNTIRSTFFIIILNRVDKSIIIVRSGQAFFISRAKKILLATWLQSQPAWSERPYALWPSLTWFSTPAFPNANLLFL